MKDSGPWEEGLGSGVRAAAQVMDPALPGLLIAATREPIFAKDEAGRYVYANAAWAGALGQPPERITGMTDHELIDEHEAAALRAVDLAVMRTRAGATTEVRLSRGGSDRIYECVTSVWLGAHGQVCGVIGAARDVTAEQALHESDAHSHALSGQSATQPSSETSPRRAAPGRRAAQLRQVTAELEATVEELQRRTAEAEAARARAERTEQQARLLDEASRVLHSRLDDPLETLQTVADFTVPRLADRCEIHLRAKETDHRIESGRGSALHDELARSYPVWAEIGPERVARTGASELYPEIDDETLRRAAIDDTHHAMLRKLGLRSAMIVPMKAGGLVIGTISLLSEVSGRRFGVDDLRMAEELARRAALAVDNARLYREAHAASRAKSEFLATMSHELRTPLNAISGYTDLLQLGIADRIQQRQHLDRIKASTWHLLSMIEEILTFSRLEAGRAHVRLESVDARELVHETAAILDPAVADKRLVFRLRVPVDPVPLETDRLKVRQILMNLLSNAVKFTSSGGITLELEHTPHEVIFRVGDTGCGIRREDLDRIYDPFWQADRGRTRRTGGTGIGLAVARQLAGLLGGRLDVESRVGQGSTFTLQVPR